METTGESDSSMHHGDIPEVQCSEEGVKGDVKGHNDSQQAPYTVDPNAMAGGSRGVPNKMKGKQSYASLFKDNRAPVKDSLLKYIEPPIGEVVIGGEDIESVEKTYGFCLIGYVMGPRPSAYNVLYFVKRWGGNVKFIFKENGWILFKFSNEVQRDSVLNGGPYLILGRQLFLKTLPSCFLFAKEDMMLLPSWVQIYGLPADCWTVPALSRIASVVGKPIHTDQLTISKQGSTYARVLVEIDAKKPRVWEYSVKLPTGKVTVVNFKYELDPKLCDKCNTLGHTTEMCGVTHRKNNNTQQKKQQDMDNKHVSYADKKSHDNTVKEMAAKQCDTPESSNSKAAQHNMDTAYDLQNSASAATTNLMGNRSVSLGQTLGGQNPDVWDNSGMQQPTKVTVPLESLGTTDSTKDHVPSVQIIEHHTPDCSPVGEMLPHDDFGDDDMLSSDGNDSVMNRGDGYEFEDFYTDDVLSRVRTQGQEEWKTVSKKNRRLKNQMKNISTQPNRGSENSSMETEYVPIDPTSNRPVKGAQARVFRKSTDEARRPYTAFSDR